MPLSPTFESFFKNQRLRNDYISQKSIAILFFVIFVVYTTTGIIMQDKMGILFIFSFSNLVVFALSVLYIIMLSQYFLLKDNAFFYYVLFLVLNIFYFHNVVFFGEHQNSPKFNFLHNKVLLSSLLFTYFLYSQFALYFLNLKETNVRLEKKIKACSKFYLIIFFTDVVVSVIEYFCRGGDAYFNLFLLACILVGLYAIINIIAFQKTCLARIFIAGTICYYTGSVLGFLFSGDILSNPFINIPMKNWPFFTEVGTLLEVIFFSTGLAYRMRLIEIEKFAVEQELLKEKLKELEFRNALLKQRESISNDLHDDVGATLNSISVNCEIAKEQFQKFKPEARETLDRIGAASLHLIDSINDIVWAVNPKNDVFENITTKMRLFAADLLIQNDVAIDFFVDEKLNTLNLSVEARKHFYLIFKEAINNIYKHAKCTGVKTRIELKGDKIQMLISDDGIGFDSLKAKQGNGQMSMQNRAKKLNGTLEIQSQSHKGTNLKLSFPYY